MSNYYHSHSGTQHHSLHPNDPNPYFQHSGPFSPVGPSPSESPLKSLSPQLTGNPLVGQSGQSIGRSSSPVTTVGNFSPFASTSPDEYTYQHMHDRFPFSGSEAHAATAIRG